MSDSPADGSIGARSRNALDALPRAVTAGANDEAFDIDLLQHQTADLAEHLLLALSAGRLGTWRWDRSTGVTMWDEEMERLFGLQPGTFDGTYEAWVALLHPEDVERSLGVLDRAVEANGSYTTEHRVVWPDGSVHWIHGRGKTVSDADGNVLGTIGCSSDITDRKLAEAAAARRVREAESVASRERLQRERLEFLGAINDLAQRASGHLDLMRAVARAAVPRLGDWCSIDYRSAPGANFERVLAHVDPAKQQWAAEVRDRYPVDVNGRMGVAAVMRTGRLQFIKRVDSGGLAEAIEVLRPLDAAAIRPVVDALQLTSVITVPLISKRGIVGAMQFVSAESGREYDESDVALAEAAAGRVAESIDNAWLVEQQRDIALTLQAALLPASIPEIPGASLAVRYWAAGAVTEVGGDFYDVFPIAPRTWAIVVGDVCGTGPTAAAVTAIARHTIRAAATHGASPTEVLEWVNAAILASGGGLFCTVLYATLQHLEDGAWSFTSVAGGHPLPILVEQTRAGDEPTARMLGRTGTLIGVLPKIKIEATTTVLAPAATVVIHTDGVNDVRPPHALDDTGLRLLVAEASAVSGPAEVVAERLGTAISDILPIPDRDDDVAMVVLRIG